MNSRELEARVLETLQSLEQGYQQLVVLTNELLQIGHTDPAFPKRLEHIQAQRIEIETLQNQSAPAYEQYIGSREHASPAVRELSARVADLVQGLIISFNSLERETRETQKMMQPSVNKNLLAVQMKSAYKRNTV